MPATLDYILRVPGNRAAFDKLAALLQSGEAIAFTGAGTSVPLYPLWPALIRRFSITYEFRQACRIDARRHRFPYRQTRLGETRTVGI
jgi:hypothetical protein